MISPRKVLWIGSAISVAVVAVGLWVERLSLTSNRMALFPFLAASILILNAFKKAVTVPAFSKILSIVEGWTLLMLIGTIGAVSTYIFARATTGYVDNYLVDIDNMIGFYWPRFYIVYMSTRSVHEVAQLAYGSLNVSPFLIIAALGWEKRISHMHRFLIMFGGTLMITVIIFSLMPASSPLTHFYGANATLRHTSGITSQMVIDALRDRTLNVVDLDHLVGLVSVPSFHVISAILFIWASWPVWWLRWPMTVINIAMFFATIVEGSHYLIDVLAGTTLALLAIAVPTLLAWTNRYLRNLFKLRVSFYERHAEPQAQAIWYRAGIANRS